MFGRSEGRPFLETDLPAPLSVYGQSKYQGEKAVLDSGADAAIVRTAWLYSAYGNNFLKSMLRLMNEKEQLSVVADQVGCPTSTQGLAAAIWALATSKKQLQGTLHWTDAGVASWYDFAIAIQQIGLEQGLLASKIPIKPIRTEDYPTAAERPKYSVLDKTQSWQQLEMNASHWREALNEVISELK